MSSQANQTTRVLWRLPKHYIGPVVRLDSICDTPWQEFQTMQPDERLLYVRSVLDEYLPATPDDKIILAAIRDKRSYDALRWDFRFLETGTDIRNYWIYGLAQREIVGNFEVHAPLYEKEGRKALTIGFDVLEKHRGHNYASVATHLFTQSAAARGVASHFYADVVRDSDHEASARSFIKAGFQEIPEGNYTPNGLADECERQFALELPVRNGGARRPRQVKLRPKQYRR